MTDDTTGKRRRTENLAGQATTTEWDCCHKIESAYPFDDIGNRRSSLERRVQSVEYVANNLNQYTSIEQSEQSTNLSSVALAKEDRTILSMSYDRMGRRVTKNDQRFVYNGYLQIADNNGKML